MTSSHASLGKKIWSESRINQEKKSIKDELEALPLKERLPYILKLASVSAQSTEPEAQVRRFIYSISALLHHEKYGGLSTSQVWGLAQVTQTILQTNRIRPVSSKLCFLYGEIHLALSHIFRKEGKHDEATWEQLLSEHLSRSRQIGGPSFSSFLKALRFMRLGDASSALREYERAENVEPHSQFFERSRIGRIRALRLSGKIEDASKLIHETRKLFRGNTPEAQELEWEMICVEFQKNGNPVPFFATTRPKSSHYQAVYVVEAFFWAHSIECRAWERNFSKISSLLKNKTLKISNLGFFHHCALDLEKCYDTDVPLLTRLEIASKCLAKRSKLLAIDRELLLLAAMTRWLMRSKALDLAEVTLNNYRALSLRLSSGKKEDALGVLGNVMTKFSDGKFKV